MSKETSSLRTVSPVGRIFDFPEILPPMLVKELRQGLRSSSFTGLFIVMQAILGFTILLMLHQNSDEPQSVSITLFSIYIIAICGIQPLRGMNAISSEVSGDTIDLVLITRLSSWKIVFGKWFSIMGQSLIFSVSLLPYLILRYFLGDMSLLIELTTFGLVFVAGGVSTAIAVGASAIATPLLRYIVSGGLSGTLLIILLQLVAGVILRDELAFLFRSSVTLDVILYSILGYLILSFYLIWMLLDFGTSIIAPLSENRSTMRRILYTAILSLSVLACWLIHSYASDPTSFIIMIQFIMLCLFVPLFVTTFTEMAYLSPRVALAMRKRKILRKFKTILYPGWAPGSIFLTLCILAHLAMILFLVEPSSSRYSYYSNRFLEEIFSGITCVIGSLVFPAAAVTLFAKNHANRLGIYLIILISSVLFMVIVIFLAETIDESLAIVFCWIPTVNFYNIGEGIDDAGTVGVINSLFIIGYGLIILFGSRSAWKHIKEQELYAAQLENENKAVQENEEQVQWAKSGDN